MNSASVACRQLKCGQVVSVLGWAYFGPGEGSILLDDVKCAGTESHIWDCSHAGWNKSDCGHNEDVSVVCSDAVQSTIAPTVSTERTQTTISSKTTLVTDRFVTPTTQLATSTDKEPSSTSTVVTERSATSATEIPGTTYEGSTSTTGEDGTSEIPTLSWKDSESSTEPTSPIPIVEGNVTVTSTPEIPSTAPKASSSAPSTAATQPTAVPEILTTSGEEPSSTCTAVTEGSATSATEIPDTTYEADVPALSLRLADGDSRCSGRVELYYNGSWGTVCDDAWDLGAAEVVCRQLGCGEPMLAVPEAQFGQGSGNILLDEVQCRGDEDSLWDCSHRGIGVHNCQPKEDAGVICAEPVTPPVPTEPVPAELSLRLVNGDNECSGRLEVFYNGSWGTICDDDWDINSARVVCRELSCGDAISAKKSAFFGEGTGDILMDDVKCTGDESFLEQCSHRELGTHDCLHKEDAGVICTGPVDLTTPGTTAPTESTTAETSATPAGSTTSEAPVTTSPTPGPAATTSSPAGSTMSEAPGASTTPLVSSTLPVSSTPQSTEISTSSPKPVPTSQATLACLPTYMRAIIRRSYINSRGYLASDIHLRDPRCKPVISSYHVMFRIPYDGCGTQRLISRGAITYSNTVEGSISSNSYSRNRNPLLNFACKIYDDAGAQTIPSVIRPPYQETPSRQFVVKFAFYDSPSFSNVVKAAPYYVMPSRDLFVRATLYSTQPNVMLFADTCVVSPNPHDFVTVASDIIRNGCVRDPTYRSYLSPDSRIVQFRFRAPSFISRYSSVYLQCKMAVCNRYDYSSRCYQGCIARGKRSTGDGSGNVIIVVSRLQ
ncbi:deleted in malignant brain tumors 1 protein-like [Tympanuchus pallidicinctus]|uniref:deleted in malignant brain tumors 1 protein-like n=1 Tax=Tympanuchus pallidicinctus TaxID=109042 RepID=UPI0022876058|nr:deleted in malignant brain tumors 1 protein-like [Tympanuchus pallidicinctus]